MIVIIIFNSPDNLTANISGIGNDKTNTPDIGIRTSLIYLFNEMFA